MSAKRKFKRDYIILEAKDMNFRSKERVLPKAFAKIEINDEKSVVALYVENLKNLKDGYDVIVLRSDYEKVNLGKINLNNQGKGEFILDLNEEDSDIKAVALAYDKYIPLIGFKGNKIENYEDLIFDIEDDEVIEEDEEIQYDDLDSEYEYEEVEYIYEDDLIDDENQYEYEEIEYFDEDNINNYEDINNIDETTQNKNIYENIDKAKISYKYIQNKSYPKKEEYEMPKKTIESEKNNKKIIKDEFNNVLNIEDEENKVAGKLLMPRQIKKNLKYFKEVKPFAADYVENTRWWKIDINPTTMCGYTMPHLGYITTLNHTIYSDIAMNAYKYRHYLFGVQYDDYNKRKNYIYAIPGKKSEQPDKGITGFTAYQPCDNRNNSLGYWLCFIDSRIRKIVK